MGSSGSAEMPEAGGSSWASSGSAGADDDAVGNDSSWSSSGSAENSEEDKPASAVVDALETPNTETPVLRGNECRCSDEVSTVCGADGNSYANACSAKCKKVEVVHKGKC